MSCPPLSASLCPSFDPRADQSRELCRQLNLWEKPVFLTRGMGKGAPVLSSWESGEDLFYILFFLSSPCPKASFSHKSALLWWQQQPHRLLKPEGKPIFLDWIMLENILACGKYTPKYSGWWSIILAMTQSIFISTIISMESLISCGYIQFQSNTAWFILEFFLHL